MYKIKAVEISILKPAYFDERSLVNNVSAFKRDFESTSSSIGVSVEDIYLDDATGEIVVRFEIIDENEFVGQYRLIKWVTRVGKKHLRYD